MKVYVKNMVCNRCILIIKQLLDKQNLAYTNVQLGEIDLISDSNTGWQDALKAELHNLGFELIDDRKTRMIEKIKNTIVKMVHQEEDLPKSNISDYLAEQLHFDYNYLSYTFSEVENITIEKYIINQKIERVKELLVYDELSLNEIAYQMGYSSVAHLSNQFKKVTGLTPSHFKKVKENKRKPLDQL
jgi:YesN/AraC family two-component response regulator